MKGVKYLLTLLLIFSFLFNAKPQAPQKGCLISSTVHTSTEDLGLVNVLLITIFGGTAAYKASPTEPQTSACVSFSQTKWVNPSGACRVCPNGYSVLNLVTGCNGPSLEGQVVTKTVVSCNLDDYSWALGTAAGIFGLLIIRKRNKH